MTKERVLVVDDDESLLYLMALTLERSNYDVVSTKSGLKALTILREKGPFAVLLTDLMMPDLHGQDLLREAKKVDPQIESIVITAAGSLESAIHSMRADGAYDYLLKPLDSMNQLPMAVDRAVAHRRLKLEREALYAEVKSDAERLQTLIANTGDAILSGDVAGVLTIVNPAAMRLLGREDLSGRNASEVLPAPLLTILENWLAISRRHPAVVEVPWGAEQVQMVNLSPILRKEGEAGSEVETYVGWVMVLRDITHFKKSDELKTQLLTEAANKIHFPLVQAVNALAELDIASSHDAHIAGIVYRLTKVWGRIQEWVDDLPTLLQLDSGLTVKFADTDLAALLVQIRPILEERVRPRGMQLDIHIEPDLPLARIDSSLFTRMMQGLVNRAALRSKRSDAIQITARGQHHQVWVEVSDNGPAISEEELPHVFERSLVRLDSDPENTGLELPLAKAIMDRMGGQVWVSGQDPVGSAITVCLATASGTLK